MKNITTKQYFELKKVDMDDAYEVLSILLDLDEVCRYKLLEKPYRKIVKQLNRFKIEPFDFNTKAPNFIMIGRKLYHVQKDLDNIPYGRYLESIKIIADYKGTDQEALIPELVSVIFNCDLKDVMNAKASNIIPLGAFFLRSCTVSERLKVISKGRSLRQSTSRQESDSLINTNTTIS